MSKQRVESTFRSYSSSHVSKHKKTETNSSQRNDVVYVL